MSTNNVTSKVHAIETYYRGWRMRSRLEARWAIYFDTTGIQFVYEPEGFDLGDGLGRYLPDFWLPQVRMWAEVKPEPLTPLEIQKCDALAKGTGHPCLMLVGPPEIKVYWAREPVELGGMVECDYILDHPYLDENRFYACTSFDDDTDRANWFSKESKLAVIAARGARFEHGERHDA